MSKSIVILGAGFGGLRCALDLARRVPSGWRVVLVDRNAHHLYTPRLYEMIIPSRSTYPRTRASSVRGKHVARNTKYILPIEKILKGTRVEFVQGEVQGVDCKKQRIVISTKRPAGARGEISHGANMQGVRSLDFARDDENLRLSYDYLVLALGSGTDYFGIPGLQEYGCTLKSVEDAERIRWRVQEFLKYSEALSPERRRQGLPFSIVIGGAGATGVEVAAELAYLFRRMPRELWSVTLVEALSSVLWMFPKLVGEYAHQRLTKLGVHIMLDTCIKRVDQGKAGVEVMLALRPLKAGETEAALACDVLPEHEKRACADLLVWAGGIRANPLLTACGMAVDRKGRVEVDEYMQVKGMAGVFALGDSATLLNPETKQPVPATAQAALEQGKLVAENIGRLVKNGGLASGAPEARPLVSYKFHDFPAVVPLTDRDGVALIGKYIVRGFPAWVLREAADFHYYTSIVGWWRAMRLCFFR